MGYGASRWTEAPLRSQLLKTLAYVTAVAAVM